MVAAPPECLDENTILEFVAGTPSDAMRARIEAHIDVCPACAVLVADAALQRSGIVAIGSIDVDDEAG